MKKRREKAGKRSDGRKSGNGTGGPNKVMLARLLRIHEQLNDARRARRPVNCTTLARDLELSPKTIQRDLNYLRDELRLPLEYDYGTKGFRYESDDLVPFPIGHNLTPEERIALVVARQCLEVFEGVDFGRHLRSALARLTGGLVGIANQPIEGELDAFLSVRTPGAGRADPEVFRRVRTALLRARELTVEHRARGATTHAPMRVQPLHLACVASRWVLVARDTATGKIETYVLARFRNPVVRPDSFERPADFDPSAHLGTTFGAWTGPGKTLVRLRLSPAGAHHVLERRWHPTQQVSAEPGGGAVVTFELADLHDVARWILSLGADCEVLAPDPLRAHVEEQGRQLARINATGGGVAASLGPRGPETFVGYSSREMRDGPDIPIAS